MLIGTHGQEVMSERSLVRGLLDLAFAAALLVAVMTSPIRPPVSKTNLSRANYLRRNFGLPPTHSSRLFAIRDTSHPATVRILFSETEEESNAAMGPVPGPFLSPSILPFKPAFRDLAGTGPISAPRPLRC